MELGKTEYSQVKSLLTFHPLHKSNIVCTEFKIKATPTNTTPSRLEDSAGDLGLDNTVEK